MPSSYSPSLRIELPGSGEQSGVWGTTTNNNLGTLLEQSIAGVQAITMTDANYTLSNYNGVSDEARKAVLVVSGTNAAVRDIIAPLTPKVYTIKNNTTGGFAINIRAPSGASVSIPNGVTSSVYCDGTNFNLALTQTLVADGTGISIGVVGATNTISFGPITSAQLASALTDETGTGSAVFATSPTLVTPNLGTPTTLVGTNITGTAASLTAGNATNAVTATTANAVASGITITSPVIAGTPSGVGVLTSGTAQSASGATVSFTGIPSWAKRITVLLKDVTTVSTGLPAIRAGAGSYEATGYSSTNNAIGQSTVASSLSATTSWDLQNSGGSTQIYSGQLVITRLEGYLYTIAGQVSYNTNGSTALTTGYKTFSGDISQLQLRMSTGADTFNGGSINIMYE